MSLLSPLVKQYKLDPSDELKDKIVEAAIEMERLEELHQRNVRENKRYRIEKRTNDKTKVLGHTDFIFDYLQGNKYYYDKWNFYPIVVVDTAKNKELEIETYSVFRKKLQEWM